MWNIPIRWRRPNRTAELAVQLEDLLHQVWECERWWRLEDRLDLAARVTVIERPAPRRRARREPRRAAAAGAPEPTEPCR